MSIIEVVFVVSGVAHLCAALLLTWDLHRVRARPAARLTDPVSSLVAGGLVALACGLDLVTVMAVTLAGTLITAVATRVAGSLRPAGVDQAAGVLKSDAQYLIDNCP